MARKRHNQKSTHSGERDDISPSLETLLRPQKIITNTKPLTAFSPSPIKPLVKTLREVEDRRTFHPQAEKRPARSINRAQHKLVINKPHAPRLSNRVKFDAPKNVLICIRRKMRKEVLFAKSKTGKGSRAKRHRQTYYSEVSC